MSAATRSALQSVFLELTRRATFEGSALIRETAAPVHPRAAVPGVRQSLPGQLPFTLSPDGTQPTAPHWSTWLHAAGAVQRVDVGPGVSWPHHRPTPSARCLHPAQVSLIAAATPDLRWAWAAGTYRYDALHHQLIRRSGQGLPDLQEHLGIVRPDIEAGAVVSIDWSRSHLWYGQFSYRLALLEAGMQVALLAMVAEALGWQVSLLWDFPDAAINAMIGAHACERAVALILLSRQPGRVRTPVYALAPPVGSVREPWDLGALDRCTHLQRRPGHWTTRPGAPGRVRPDHLAPSALLHTIRARHSGHRTFAPCAEYGDEQLLRLLQAAAGPFPVAGDARPPAVALRAVLNTPGGLEQHLIAPAGSHLLGPVLPHLYQEVQPDMPLCSAPLTASFWAPLPGPQEARNYRRLNLEAGLMAQRSLLLAAAQGLVGRVSCSFGAAQLQRAIQGPAGSAPLLQIVFGHEPPERWAQTHFRLAIHP